ncbi:MAG: hypothetical protein ABH842_04580 [Candidatus Micrarchaeota archaeon]
MSRDPIGMGGVLRVHNPMKLTFGTHTRDGRLRFSLEVFRRFAKTLNYGESAIHFATALQSSNREKRMNALKQITSKEDLIELAYCCKYKEVRIEAMKILIANQDFDAIAEAFESSKYNDVKKLALEMLGFSVGRMDGDSHSIALADLVEYHPDPEVRKTAFQKLIDAGKKGLDIGSIVVHALFEDSIVMAIDKLKADGDKQTLVMIVEINRDVRTTRIAMEALASLIHH